MPTEIKIAAYQFADSMPTEKKAQLGAIIIDFINKSYKTERVKEEVTKPRVHNFAESACLSCEA